VDPRSGEIIKCDVAMGDSWVKAYLEDLELELLNFSQLAHTASTLRSALLDIDPGDLSTLKQNRTKHRGESHHPACRLLQTINSLAILGFPLYVITFSAHLT